MSARDRSNMRFYILFWLSCILVGKTSLTTSDLARIDVKKVDDSDIEAAADEVSKLYNGLGGTDQIAKGPELRRLVLEALTVKFTSDPTQPLSKTVPQA